jgi:hypothetical protein
MGSWCAGRLGSPGFLFSFARASMEICSRALAPSWVPTAAGPGRLRVAIALSACSSPGSIARTDIGQLRTALKAKATPSFVSPDNSRVGRARAALGRQCSLGAAATTTNPPRAARAHRPRPQAIQPRPLRNQLRRRAAEQARSPLVRRSRCQSRLCECPSLFNELLDVKTLARGHFHASFDSKNGHSPLSPRRLNDDHKEPSSWRLRLRLRPSLRPRPRLRPRLRPHLRPRPCASTASSAHQSLF